MDSPRARWARAARYPTDQKLLVAAVLCVVAAGLLMGVWDRGVSDHVLAWQSPVARIVFEWATRLGNWRVEAGVLLLAVGLGSLLRRPRLWVAGLSALAALSAAGLLTELLKHTICRTRPLLPGAGTFHPPLCFQTGIDSFPSGHASQAFAIAATLAAAYPRLAVPSYGLAAAVGLSRVFLGAHYASDVLGGAAVGLLIGVLCRRQVPRLISRAVARARGAGSTAMDGASSPRTAVPAPPHPGPPSMNRPV